MFRSLFLSLSKAAWAQRWITRWGFAWRAARRFVAGNTPEEAVQAVRELNAQGITATLDHLGENTSSVVEASQAAADVVIILQAIGASAVQANVSIKLTQLGLLLDEQLCRENLLLIAQEAQQQGIFVRIDMEDSSLTEKTLVLLRWLRQQGFDFGVVIQAYLYRSDEDVMALMAERVPVRLVKGAYRESPQVAYPRKADVDAAFDRLTQKLIDGAVCAGAPLRSADGRRPPIPAIASHDVARLRFAQQAAQQSGLPKGALEFQMLYGIRRDLQLELTRAGYPVRVYVPYGTHWYPYFMRRLAERPANVWFFLSNLLRK
jgi:proline dehydrogenase